MLALFRSCLLLCWGLLFALWAQAAAFEDNMAQRTQACTACHGTQGRAGPDGYYPRLAGKPAAYLYNQLQHFKNGRRHYPLMAGLLDTLDDAYLKEIAAYFSALYVPYPQPTKTAVGGREMERGRKLVTQGNAAQGIPACTQCHGTLLTGVLPATPGLLGLPADYINAQLGGWQTGQRHAAEPDCMAKVAQRLSPSDTSAIARWLAAQPLPANTHAIERNANPAPASLACGSDAVATPQAQSAAAATSRDSEAVSRGAYLARIGNCALCHTQRGGVAYAGGRDIDTPFGAVYSSNITPHGTRGIGAWSADDFWKALHQGLSKDGHALYPAFPYTSYTHMSRADADALFAFLKTVPASAQANQPHALRWPYSTQLALSTWRSLFFKPADAPSAAATPAHVNAADSAAWQRGRYLVQGPGHCVECHGARNALGALAADSKAGGNVLYGSQWYAPALNEPGGASVADWSEADIALFLQTGRNNRAQASGPMAEVVLHGTQYLSDADARAMATYLKAMPQQWPAPAQQKMQASKRQDAVGERLYNTHCADCHGEQGQGRAGVYPAFAGTRSVTQERPNNLINAVLAGGFAAATAGHPRPYGMPPFLLRLSDAEIAAVLSYIRSSWGNQAPPVSEFDINTFRRSQAP